MASDYFQIIIALGVIFIGALVGGRVAALCRIPRVTGYLLAGLFVGPSFADLFSLPQLVTPFALNELRLITDVALALILMNIGGQLCTRNLRRWKQRIFIYSITEALFTGLLVGLAVFLTNQFVLQALVGSLTLLKTSTMFGIFAGIIGMATAPAATLMVVREYEAEGPVTSTLLTLVGLNNLISVFAFTIAAELLVSDHGSVSHAAYQIVMPLVVGGLFGFGMSVWAQRLDQSSEHKILLLGGVTMVVAVSRGLGIEPLLTCMALG